MNNQLRRLDKNLNLLKNFAEYYSNEFIARPRHCLKVFGKLRFVIFDQLEFVFNFDATYNTRFVRL